MGIREDGQPEGQAIRQTDRQMDQQKHTLVILAPECRLEKIVMGERIAGTSSLDIVT